MKRPTMSLGVVIFSSILLAGLPALAQSSSAARVAIEGESSSPTTPPATLPATLPATIPADNSSGIVDIATVIANLDNETFINFLHHMDMSEITEGTASLEHIGDQHVREFTQTMIADHQQNEELVKDLAAKKGWTLFTYQPSTLDIAVSSELQALTGSNFDLVFLRMVLMGHEKALQDLRLLQNQANDPDLQNLLNVTIPVIEKHIDLANTNLGLLWEEINTVTH